MNCPECNYDIFPTYYDVLSYGEDSEFCKITDYHSEYSLEAINAHSWYVECKCPKCGKEWGFPDSDN